MKAKIKIGLKGFVFGVANIIPGVRGGTIAITMGIYEDLISSISNIRKDFKKSMSLLVPFLNAATKLWANDVAEPETIDKTWMLATGAPKGPFHIIDIVGLTTLYNIALMNPEAQDPDSLQSKMIEKLKEKIDKGELGINAGKGFYEY